MTASILSLENCFNQSLLEGLPETFQMLPECSPYGAPYGRQLMLMEKTQICHLAPTGSRDECDFQPTQGSTGLYILRFQIPHCSYFLGILEHLSF